jgi:putative restriction endonuclease
MVKLLLVYKEDSQYHDTPDVQYDFPQRYLAAAKQGVGDWAVYYNPVKAGGQGYFAVAKITEVIPTPRAEGRYLALIAQGSFLPFDQDVPRLENGRPWEAMLAG